MNIHGPQLILHFSCEQGKGTSTFKQYLNQEHSKHTVVMEMTRMNHLEHKHSHYQIQLSICTEDALVNSIL